MMLLGRGRLAQQLDCVRQHGEDDAQVFDCAFGAAGQIDDQRAAPDAGHRAAEHGMRRHAAALAAHRLGQAGRLPFDDRARGLRRHIARCEAGAAGRQDQIERQLIGAPTQPGRDLGRFIGHDAGYGDLCIGPMRAHGLRQSRAAQIGPLAARAAVTDGEDADAYHQRSPATAQPSRNRTAPKTAARHAGHPARCLRNPATAAGGYGLVS